MQLFQMTALPGRMLRSAGSGPLLATVLLLLPLAGSCPLACLCEGATVTCRNIENEGIPRNIPSTTKHVLLFDSDLGEIRSEAFRGLPLTRLLIHNCNVRRIHSFAFRGLANLEQLSVRGNPVDQLIKYSMSGISNVSRLDLGQNRISLIQQGAFSLTENIQRLVLSDNPLTTLKNGAFTGLRRVSFFDLPTLELVSRIEPYAFSGMSGVVSLVLRRARLPLLEKFVFRDLINVTYLTLSEFEVKLVESGAFQGLKNVHHLTLANCNFTHIDRLAFGGMHNISKLTFRDNFVRDIDADAFGDASSTTFFKFIGNSFGSVKKASLNELFFESPQVTVEIRQNLFHCGCHTSWIFDEDVNLDLAANRCSAPRALQGRLLSEVDILELKEQCPISSANYIYNPFLRFISVFLIAMQTLPVPIDF